MQCNTDGIEPIRACPQDRPVVLLLHSSGCVAAMPCLVLVFWADAFPECTKMNFAIVYAHHQTVAVLLHHRFLSRYGRRVLMLVARHMCKVTNTNTSTERYQHLPLCHGLLTSNVPDHECSITNQFFQDRWWMDRHILYMNGVDTWMDRIVEICAARRDLGDTTEVVIDMFFRLVRPVQIRPWGSISIAVAAAMFPPCPQIRNAHHNTPSIPPHQFTMRARSPRWFSPADGLGGRRKG
mmetsp:Transcript_5818/g.15770  ORF Transcript_5818/g.15770 Transcript_5818/m.15770 type:complete len:238 (+) Transcript_5818:68-781(+)